MGRAYVVRRHEDRRQNVHHARDQRPRHNRRGGDQGAQSCRKARHVIMPTIAILAGQGWMLVFPSILINSFVLFDATRCIVMVVGVGCHRSRHMRDIMRGPRNCRACKEQDG